MSLQRYPTKTGTESLSTFGQQGTVTSYPYQSFTPRWNANYMFQNHHLCLHRGYMAFRADEMKVTQQTTEASVNFHDKY